MDSASYRNRCLLTAWNAFYKKAISSVHALPYRNPILIAAILLLVGSETAIGQTSGLQLFSDSRPAMGTIFRIYLYSPDREKAFAQEVLSNYRPNSEVSRINRVAGVETVTTDPEVFHLLQRSFEFSRRTQGAFDITVGPLMRAWGFFRENGRYPTSAELSQARASTGWDKVKIHPDNRSVRFRAPGM